MKSKYRSLIFFLYNTENRVCCLTINLELRKVAEFEKEKVLIMNNFIEENKSKFKYDNLQFSNKLKK